MLICIWEEFFGLFRVMKICYGGDSCYIYLEDGCVVIFVEFGIKKDKKRLCNNDESKLKNKVKYIFKIFFMVVFLKCLDINVCIIDLWIKVDGIGRCMWYKRNECKYKLEVIF